MAASTSLDDIAATLKNVGLDSVPAEPNTYPALNPFDIFRSHIAEELSKITEIESTKILPVLQWTAKAENGDIQLAVPALRVKGKNPQEFAKELGTQFPETPLVQKPIVTATFLNWHFNPQVLTSIVLPMILRSGEAYGFNKSLGLKDPSNAKGDRRTLVIDFSSPNTIIGGFLANLFEAAGWNVVRLNYLGDWGKQYGVLAVGFDQFGSEEELEKNPIGHLYDIYVKISKISAEEADKVKELKAEVTKLKEENKDFAVQEQEINQIEENGVDAKARAYFKGMVQGEPRSVPPILTSPIGIWRRFRVLSIERYRQTYSRLNIEFDDYNGESTIKEESMDEAARIMEEKKVSENSDGAVIVDLSKYSKKLGKAVVKKKDGTSLYLTRDIAAVRERFERYHFDKARMIYVVASQQDLHFAQLFKIVELMGFKDLADKCQHINFGMVLGMSTRKGTAKFLDDILRDVGEKMHDVMRANQAKYEQVEDPEKTADTLGIAAVMIQDMKGKRINNYNFDMDRMTSFEGDTGPYLEYAHARLCSIHRKVLAASPDLESVDLSKADFTLLKEPHAIDLVRQLASWPDVFLNTMKTNEPTTVLTYLFRLTHAVSSSYDHLQILGSERNVLEARLALYVAARQTLNNGMRLLGVTPVERM